MADALASSRDVFEQGCGQRWISNPHTATGPRIIPHSAALLLCAPTCRRPDKTGRAENVLQYTVPVTVHSVTVHSVRRGSARATNLVSPSVAQTGQFIGLHDPARTASTCLNQPSSIGQPNPNGLRAQTATMLLKQRCKPAEERLFCVNTPKLQRIVAAFHTSAAILTRDHHNPGQ